VTLTKDDIVEACKMWLKATHGITAKQNIGTFLCIRADTPESLLKPAKDVQFILRDVEGTPATPYRG
jgi:uncharacterized alpha-E superfamily protein